MSKPFDNYVCLRKKTIAGMRFILLLLPIFIFFSFKDNQVMPPVQYVPQMQESYTPPFEVFPNPVNHTLTLQSTSFKDIEVELNIYNVSGKLVYTQKSISFDENNKVLLNLSQLTSGLYFVQLRKDNYSATKKIVKA